MIRLRLAVIALLFSLLVIATSILPCFAGDTDVTSELDSLDLEDLLQVEMVSPSERKQSLEHIPGSYTILTAEDIKSSGAKNIPEALRTVPGVMVTRTDTAKWSIGIRGFSGVFNSKQLILVDNRPITSPYFDGVIWSTKDLAIETVKRIEIIRGPWTSLWGSESFNGVINIITKSAAEMQGTQSVTTAGTDGASQFIRHGEKVTSKGTLAVYAKGGYEGGKSYKIRGRTEKGSTNWVTGSAGFRTDWLNTYTDQFSLQGQLSTSTIDEKSPPGNHFSSDNEKKEYSGYTQLLWDRKTGVNSGMQFRTSYTRDAITLEDMDVESNAVDAEFIYSAEKMGVHLLTFGLGGRYFWDSFSQGKKVSVINDNIYRLDFSGFAKDKITIIDEKLFLTLGLKLDYSGSNDLSPQPTARLLYTEGDEEYWLALSQATRQPGNWIREGNYKIKVRDTTYDVNISSNLEPEQLSSIEAGYRKLFSKTLKLDWSLYFNNYDKLATFELDNDNNTATPASNLSGLTYGTEIALDWSPLSFLTLRPSLDLSNQDFSRTGINIPGFSPPINSPIYSVKLQALFNISKEWEFDLFSSYLNTMDGKDLSTGFGLDARLAWTPRNDLSIELIGDSLLGGVNDGDFVPAEPSYTLRLTWDF
ncbi:TonB-dependent receptor plug domain-containing protein [Maridesulfovibrio zosterae]|uniref:TonB-dependent receptor plug domain-containing protein n=1 Tax=Maridesulfovibrio zosterae TaxID=82171 RepID=UPI00042345BF|nr:TonB-dependent receptor plug domain-containing protein [Maridesulfovibrio zosterae]